MADEDLGDLPPAPAAPGGARAFTRTELQTLFVEKMYDMKLVYAYADVKVARARVRSDMWRLGRTRLNNVTRWLGRGPRGLCRSCRRCYPATHYFPARLGV